AYAASPLAQGTTGMLRAAYAYCGLPAFASLSMAGSERLEMVKRELTNQRPFQCDCIMAVLLGTDRLHSHQVAPEKETIHQFRTLERGGFDLDSTRLNDKQGFEFILYPENVLSWFKRPESTGNLPQPLHLLFTEPLPQTMALRFTLGTNLLRLISRELFLR
ncbi:MAG: hypothetical protein M3H12_03655, partial [Chromatiales bacterium]